MKKSLIITISSFVLSSGIANAQYNEFDSDSIIINRDRLNESFPEINETPFKSLEDPKIVTIESCENAENIILRTNDDMVRVFSSIRSYGQSEGEFFFPNYAYDGFDSDMGLYRVIEIDWEYVAYKYIHVTTFGSVITDGLGLFLKSPDNNRFITFHEYMGGPYFDGGLIVYSFNENGSFVKELDMSNLNPEFDIDSELQNGVFKAEWINNASFRFSADEGNIDWHEYQLEKGKWVKVNN